MMDSRWSRYFSDEELFEIELRHQMEDSIYESRRMDFILQQAIVISIKKQLRRKTPNTYRFSSQKEMDKLAKQIAEVSGWYQLAVMPFDDLKQAWQVQSYCMIKIGQIDPRKYFALIDDRARQIGVHIPKSRRQMIIEHKVEEAFKELENHLKKSNPTIKKILQEFLYAQKYPEEITPIQILALGCEINSDEEVLLPGSGRILQMRFKIFKNKSILYYHIK